jgi:hypothetical protein
MSIPSSRQRRDWKLARTARHGETNGHVGEVAVAGEAAIALPAEDEAEASPGAADGDPGPEGE